MAIVCRHPLNTHIGIRVAAAVAAFLVRAHVWLLPVLTLCPVATQICMEPYVHQCIII
ncbi:hypothetical protein DAEQUDRAFT_732124 [Daedalea quercina L-15889]|uniref:Uncharacterized protein n=1 Tax=Daedalea quercina L-15889 TaxID=1314783 RepID=A0A165LTM8_9APHY|nr:hypothetical protein DAEQUDRAFT_732124 [Daedalea quercina L-15889]